MLGDSILNPDSCVPNKYDLDGADIYGEDGQTIKTIDELTEAEIKEFIEGSERYVD